MPYLSVSSLVLSFPQDSGGFLQALWEALPRDTASLFTLTLSAFAVGLVIWAGIRSNKPRGR